jgi:hypothetical protein
LADPINRRGFLLIHKHLPGSRLAGFLPFLHAMARRLGHVDE